MCESSEGLARHRVLWSSAVVSERGIRRSEVCFLINADLFSLSHSRVQMNNILHKSIPKIRFFEILTWRLRVSLSKFNSVWFKSYYYKASNMWRTKIILPFISPIKVLFFHYEFVWCAFYKDMSLMTISNPQWKDVMGLITQMCSQLKAAKESTW